MIGEYGQLVEDGPYILEGLIDNFAVEQSRVVRLEVSACVRPCVCVLTEASRGKESALFVCNAQWHFFCVYSC